MVLPVLDLVVPLVLLVVVPAVLVLLVDLVLSVDQLVVYQVRSQYGLLVV